MEEFDCLQSYVGVPLAGELPLLIIVWRSRSLRAMILLQRVIANLLNLLSISKLKYSSVTCACTNKLHCIPCLLFVLKIVGVLNLCGFHYPQKLFNNEIFPDYGSCIVIFFLYRIVTLKIQYRPALH